ncbi:ABC transporter permease subunit [Nevskia sp.]|uniref:ABC transporter permease subunit n=1 Tax=Nevskia sp. TaxID=1929292 RepID=UPI0025E57343|nr:ABC transporter permease subunit [Nevskia sp.]
MLNHAWRRLLTAVPTLLVLVTVTFFLMRAAPGGPFDVERVLPPEIEATLAAEFHLDEPLWRQYGRYLVGLARGDLGPSFQYEGFRVSELIAKGAPVSAIVGFSALLLALSAGVGLGAVAAIHRGSAIDRGVMLLALAGLSIPPYVTAPLLILLFALGLAWLPAGGWGTVSSVILPAIALALPQVAAIARLTRGSLADVLAAPYIRTARAKGLPERVIVLRHALKPGLLPVLSYLGPAAAGLMTGSVVVEQIFGIPGIGRYFVQGALNRDYTLVLGVVLFYGAVVIAFNFLVDLAYGALDPRVRPT